MLQDTRLKQESS